MELGESERWDLSFFNLLVCIFSFVSVEVKATNIKTHLAALFSDSSSLREKTSKYGNYSRVAQSLVHTSPGTFREQSTIQDLEMEIRNGKTNTNDQKYCKRAESIFLPSKRAGPPTDL